MTFRKLCLMAAFGFAATQINAQSATSETGKSVLKVGTHYTTYLTAEDEATTEGFLPRLGFCAAYEQAVTQRKTLSLNVQYSLNNYGYGINLLPSIGSRRHLSLEVEGRHYFRTATNGFYVGLSAGILSSHLIAVNRFNAIDHRYNWLNIGAKLGYQAALSPRATLQVGIALDAIHASDAKKAAVNATDYVNPGANIMFGYRF
ncbi:MAG: hypothetical protein RL757_1294 [Bacteroidota bacterium]